MARIQILELPEGADDRRAPFVLVVDQYEPQRIVLGMGGKAGTRKGDYWHEVASQIGARGVIVTPETIEIPANEGQPRSLREQQEDWLNQAEDYLHASRLGRKTTDG
ncbi:hypothetical protein [Streptomyces malaysiensis]|uniref:hypothetical protein n=1 Tax=Streptomyces malaysiensis TaxID=92644 RepID=UPI0036AFA728